jgi:hypothetical protein
MTLLQTKRRNNMAKKKGGNEISNTMKSKRESKRLKSLRELEKRSVVNPRLKAFGDRLGKEMVGNLNREAKKK